MFSGVSIVVLDKDTRYELADHIRRAFEHGHSLLPPSIDSEKLMKLALGESVLVSEGMLFQLCAYLNYEPLSIYVFGRIE